MAPRVSVLMTVYNNEKFVQEAAESILAQTYKDLELIIVNDGSTDGTQKALDNLRDPRLIIENPGRCGRPAALNRAYKLARGEFIALMDADDVSAPQRLEEQMNAFERDPWLDFAYSPMIFTDERLAETDKRYPKRFPDSVRRTPVEGCPSCYRLEGDVFLGLVEANFIVQATLLAKRWVYDSQKPPYNEKMLRSQDFDLWLRLSRNGCHFGFLDRPLYLSRKHLGNSGSEHSAKHGAFKVKALEGALARETNPAYQAALHNSLGRQHYRQAFKCFGIGQYSEAREHYGKSIGHRPTKSAAICRSLTHAGPVGYMLARSAFNAWRG